MALLQKISHCARAPVRTGAIRQICMGFRSVTEKRLVLAESSRTKLTYVCTKQLHSSPALMCAAVKYSIINIQDEDHFSDAVLKSKVPVIVDFHASWCGPCKILQPRLETAMRDSKKEIVLAKVDIDVLGDFAMQHGVVAVPTVVAVKDGKIGEKFVGLKDDDQLKSFVRKLVA